MAEPVDFASVMAELTVFQTELAKIHSNLANAKNKRLLGDLLDRMQSARVEVETEYPKAMTAIEEISRAAVAESRAGVAKAQQRKAEAEAAKKVVPKCAPMVEPKVDPGLGQKLRRELLQRFGRQNGDGRPGANRIREAWQDWD